MKRQNLILFVLMSTILTFTSCSTSEESPANATDTDTVIASMTIDAANSFDLQTGLAVSTEGTATKKTTASCATITVDNTAGYPKTFTVDFGTSGCTEGAITRRGKLKVKISGPIYVTGSIMTVERMDYSINKLSLEGTITYVNTTSVATIPQWTRTVTNGKFTNGSGQMFVNNGSYTMRQIAGVDTPFVLTDNVYEMTEGEHTVTNEAGNKLTLTVEEPLIKNYSCEFVSKGKLQLAGSLLNGVVDYGNNICDSNYTFTLDNGFVFDLKM